MITFGQSVRIVILASGLATGLGAAAVAQGVPGAVYTITIPSSQFGSPAFLSHLVGSIGASQAFCSALKDPTLNVDCLAERLGAVSDQIPSGTDYDEVRKVLDDASKKLNRLARSNQDTSRRAVQATQPNGGGTTRPILAVAPSSVASVNADAAAILQEAQTILLRSAEGNATKASQYTQIADAIDSNKVLLRSS